MKQNNEALWKQRAFYVVKKETIMELMVPIENKDDTPLYEQIYTYIKGEIRAGSFAPEADCLLPESLQAIFM